MNKYVESECRVFVGNVPYHCTQVEFEKIFKNMDGFIKAEIITDQKTQLSRGFGFVTLTSYRYAEKLKQHTNIIFKNRLLRFTTYNETFNVSLENKNNYVLIRGIPPDCCNREWLLQHFIKYAPLGKYFIITNKVSGEPTTNGIIEILDDTKYKNVIKKKYHTVDNIVVETCKYKKSILNFPNYRKSQKKTNIEKSNIL